MEATEGEESCRKPEQPSARVDPLVAKKSLEENGRPEVTSAPSEIYAIQRLSMESEEVSK